MASHKIEAYSLNGSHRLRLSPLIKQSNQLDIGIELSADVGEAERQENIMERSTDKKGDGNTGGNIGDSMDDNIGDNIDNNAGDYTGDSIGDSIGDSVGDNKNDNDKNDNKGDGNKGCDIEGDDIDDDVFDEEDDDLLKALFKNPPMLVINTPILSVSQTADEFKVIVKSPKLSMGKPMATPVVNPIIKPIVKPIVKPKVKPIAKSRPKVRVKHPLNRHMIHTMPTQPDYLDIGGKQNNEEDDLDIVEESIMLTLMDPVSGTRLLTPLRSKFCSHNECFDYDSFLLMNHLKPFKIVVRRYSNATRYPGEVNVMALLQDSKRPPKSSKEFNKITVQYEYKLKMKQLGDRKKYFNELNYFCCPICNMEFNINQPGDVYVVGELCDLIQDVKLEPSFEEIECLEINMVQTGKWRWVRKENERKEQIVKQIETKKIELVTLDSDDEDFDPEIIKVDVPIPDNNNNDNNNETTTTPLSSLLPLPPPPLMITPPVIKEEVHSSQAARPTDPEAGLDSVIDNLLDLGEYDAEPGVFMGNIPLPASPDAQETQRVHLSNYQNSIVPFKPGEYVFTDGQGDVDDPIVLD